MYKLISLAAMFVCICFFGCQNNDPVEPTPVRDSKVIYNIRVNGVVTDLIADTTIVSAKVRLVWMVSGDMSNFDQGILIEELTDQDGSYILEYMGKIAPGITMQMPLLTVIVNKLFTQGSREHRDVWTNNGGWIGPIDELSGEVLIRNIIL